MLKFNKKNFVSLSLLITMIFLRFCLYDQVAFTWMRFINGEEVTYKNHHYTLSKHSFKLDKKIMDNEDTFLIGINLSKNILVNVRIEDFDTFNKIVKYVSETYGEIDSSMKGDCQFYYNKNAIDQLPDFFWYNHKANLFYYILDTDFLEPDEQYQIDYQHIDYSKLCNSLSKKYQK